MIEEKLRSRTGASLIAALFLFLFCAMVGTVILTAASANAGRLARRDEYERNYSNVISAAKLFADKIKGAKVKLEWTRTRTYDEGYNYTETFAHAVNDGSSSANAVEKFFVDAVGEIYEEALKDEGAETWEANFTNVNSQSAMKKFTVEIQDEDGAALSGGAFKVYGRIAFQSRNCVLMAVFSTKKYDSTASGDVIPSGAYVVRLTCSPTVNNQPASEWEVPDPDNAMTVRQTKTITFQWNDVKITEE